MKTLSNQTSPLTPKGGTGLMRSTTNSPFGGLRGLLLLLFLLLGTGSLSAAVTVTPLSVDYSTQKVTFKVSWTGTAANNRVWVWIDFCPVAGTVPATSFSTATISNPAKTGGNGTITNVTARGFFIEYSSATNAGTTVTATLSNATGKFNWCAYGSDYPPNVLANTNSSYTLAGTPPFKLIASNGATSLTVPGTTIATSALTFTPATITDATGYPGLWCPYTGSDLYMDATHRCLQRQSGAGNWEAWIKDNRDDELYRIVKMPDNKWWLAQNVKYAGAGTQPTWCTKDECGRYYTYEQAKGAWGGSSGTGANKQGVCPNNWVIPMRSDYVAIFEAYSSNMTQQCQILTPLDSQCTSNDFYGLCSKKTICGGGAGDAKTCAYEVQYLNDASKLALMVNDIYLATDFDCGSWFTLSDGSNVGNNVRCSRHL